jgi:putative two-component system response regulator
MAIVDVYDALTNTRPYKNAFSHEKALEIIKEAKGTHFDPLITDIFIKHEYEFNKKVVPRKETTQKPRINKSEILPSMKMISNIIGIRDNSEDARVNRMQYYLEIFIDAILHQNHYRDEVLTWDIGAFLMSSQLHDIGNLAVSETLLNKSDTLTEEEFKQIKEHTSYGTQIVQRVRESFNSGSILHHAEVLVGNHHEKWDGTGYPHGLRGNEIPLQGRIMAIVDVYDALTTDKPYRESKTHSEAVETIKNGSGTHFDPVLVEIFVENEANFLEVADTISQLNTKL